MANLYYNGAKVFVYLYDHQSSQSSEHCIAKLFNLARVLSGSLG